MIGLAQCPDHLPYREPLRRVDPRPGDRESMLAGLERIRGLVADGKVRDVTAVVLYTDHTYDVGAWGESRIATTVGLLHMAARRMMKNNEERR